MKAVHSDAPAQDTFIAHFNMTSVLSICELREHEIFVIRMSMNSTAYRSAVPECLALAGVVRIPMTFVLLL